MMPKNFKLECCPLTVEDLEFFSSMLQSLYPDLAKYVEENSADLHEVLEEITATLEEQFEEDFGLADLKQLAYVALEAKPIYDKMIANDNDSLTELNKSGTMRKSFAAKITELQNNIGKYKEDRDNAFAKIKQQLSATADQLQAEVQASLDDTWLVQDVAIENVVKLRGENIVEMLEILIFMPIEFRKLKEDLWHELTAKVFNVHMRSHEYHERHPDEHWAASLFTRVLAPMLAEYNLKVDKLTKQNDVIWNDLSRMQDGQEANEEIISQLQEQQSAIRQVLPDMRDMVKNIQTILNVNVLQQTFGDFDNNFRELLPLVNKQTEEAVGYYGPVMAAMKNLLTDKEFSAFRQPVLEALIFKLRSLAVFFLALAQQRINENIYKLPVQPLKQVFNAEGPTYKAITGFICHECVKNTLANDMGYLGDESALVAAVMDTVSTFWQQRQAEIEAFEMQSSNLVSRLGRSVSTLQLSEEELAELREREKRELEPPASPVSSFGSGSLSSEDGDLPTLVIDSTVAPKKPGKTVAGFFAGRFGGGHRQRRSSLSKNEDNRGSGLSGSVSCIDFRNLQEGAIT